MKKVKPQIIILDGVDKVGKTTLKRMIDKHFNYFHLVMDRGPLSHMVYNIVYNRQNQNLHIENITELCSKAILIYITANPQIVQKRIDNSHTEPEIDIKKDMQLFDTVANATLHLWKGGIFIDTSCKSPLATLLEIERKLEQIEEVMTV